VAFSVTKAAASEVMTTRRVLLTSRSDMRRCRSAARR
jgi:hypothetical protein